MLYLGFNIVGVYVCFLTWGLTQERVTSTKYGDGEKFKYFIVLNMIQAFIASLVGYIYSIYIRRDQKLDLTRERTVNFLKVAFICAIASPFGYASLKHIDYLTMTLAKSSKLIPLMLMHKILYRKTYPTYKYFVVLGITIGVFGFMVLQPKTASKIKTNSNLNQAEGLNLSSIIGLFLVFINLSLDGALNSTQEEIIKQDHKINGRNMMIYMNFFTAMLLFCWLINPMNSELYEAIGFFVRNKSAILDVLLFAFCGSIGQCFIFHMLGNYGSLTLVTVTVTRKLFTMLLSVFLYNHVLSVGQWVSVAVVFTAIAFEVVVKMQEKRSVQEKVTSLEKEKLS
ncbi:hypothetical protein BB559_001714 [Furculomyces boomerangus]|uniref:UDP-galactose transporter homolog 1 n=1 Tax=Furculomyces boomerangus TaxID=61424 RepID=A0A2T9Z0W9_9FUNG|nr:hypothetical protein BB559_001714 [Furculomyces boomerangus]